MPLPSPLQVLVWFQTAFATQLLPNNAVALRQSPGTQLYFALKEWQKKPG
jgi:hypothetical protein